MKWYDVMWCDINLNIIYIYNMYTWYMYMYMNHVCHVWGATSPNHVPVSPLCAFRLGGTLQALSTEALVAPQKDIQRLWTFVKYGEDPTSSLLPACTCPSLPIQPPLPLAIFFANCAGHLDLSLDTNWHNPSHACSFRSSSSSAWFALRMCACHCISAYTFVAQGRVYENAAKYATCSNQKHRQKMSKTPILNAVKCSAPSSFQSAAWKDK